MKKIITFIFIFIVVSVSAHEFWLQPDTFYYKKGERANIKFLVGEDFEGINWSGNHSRINSLVFYDGHARTDISSLVSEQKGDSIGMLLNSEGTKMITFNSKNSFLYLESSKFNDYLLEDGLTTAIEYRKKHNQTDSIGKEFYQRSVKTIFQCGGSKDKIFYTQTDLPLDIVPAKNPYALKDKEVLFVKIFFQKKPLVNHKIRLWQKQKDKPLHSFELVTNDRGEISLEVSIHGRWMVSTVNMIHLENNPQASWQSYWGSCTWGYE